MIMSRPTTRLLVLLFLAAGTFTLATIVQPFAGQWSRGGNSAGVLEVLLGDGRRLFARHFFVKADITFHSGYYPSIFDQAQAPADSGHMNADETEGHHNEAEEAHEKQMSFLGGPQDWIEGFGRNFMVTQHSHLEGGKEREMLPWLRISADLDPQRVETYTVGAFVLRRKLGKINEAEQFLREGLRANPDSYEILLELGRLYHEDLHDNVRARNVFLLALRRWQEQQDANKHPEPPLRGRIALNLARLEESEGHLEAAIAALEIVKATSPQPKTIQQQIDELKQKSQGQRPASSPTP
jgi:tetratricopeptide (TPR) repeat protein